MPYLLGNQRSKGVRAADRFIDLAPLFHSGAGHFDLKTSYRLDELAVFHLRRRDRSLMPCASRRRCRKPVLLI